MLLGPIRIAGTWLALCLMPALLVYLVREAQIPVPGNSLHNDPDWYYLGNSLQLALGERAYLMEHPGMPISVLGAVLLWLKLKLFPESSEPDMVAEVFLHSPEYHRYLGNCGLALTALALFVYGLVLQRKYVPLWVAVASQGLFLWAPNALRFTGRWMPEGVMILLGTIYGILYLGLLAGARGAAPSITLGGFLGLMTAVKMNFYPFVLLMLLRGWKGVLTGTAAAAAVFGAFMLALQPERALWLPIYFYRMLLNKGVYGSGEQGQPGFSEMMNNLARIGAEHWLSLQQLGWAGAIAVLAFVLSLRWKDRRQCWLMLSGLLIVALNVLGQAKHPGARYSLPIFVFVPSIVAAFWAAESERWARAAMGVAVLGMLWSGARLLKIDFENMSQEAAAVYQQEKEIEKHLSARPECLHLFHDAVASYRCSNFSANGFAGGAYSERLFSLYPRTWIFRILDNTFFRYQGGPVGPGLFAAALDRASCVYFYVRKDFPEPFGLPLFRARAWKTVFQSHNVELRFSDRSR